MEKDVGLTCLLGQLRLPNALGPFGVFFWVRSEWQVWFDAERAFTLDHSRSEIAWKGRAKLWGAGSL
ncbi:MAG: hypothetical protein AcusKO_42380 [Acuticoccus sp.]